MTEDMQVTFYVQADGCEYKVEDITSSCRKDCVSRNGFEAENMEIYINTDTKTAYYVADGKNSPEYKVAF